MTFGEKLKALRAEKHYTQKEVAEKIGVSVQTYLSYESGRRKPLRKPENYDKLAEALGCEKSYLMTDDDTAAPVQRRRGPRGPRKQAVKAGPSVRVELQYDDVSISYDELISRARDAAPNAEGEIALYVKPQEHMAYFVAGEESGSFAI